MTVAKALLPTVLRLAHDFEITLDVACIDG